MKINNCRGISALLILFSCTLWARNEQDAIDRGEYLARAADCRACHTGREDKPFAGGVRIETPLGAIWSTNITPDRQTGIGRYSQQAFSRALRDGVADSGHNLYPAMPYTAFNSFNDRQVHDLYTYFMQGVPAIHQQNRDSEIPWPLNMRWPIGLWNLMFQRSRLWHDDPQRSAAWNRGAWLVQGPGHCGSCHTPRGIAFQETGRDEHDKHYLSGGVIGGWSAPNLKSEVTTGLGSWGEQDIVDFLYSGQNDRSMAFGDMAEVVQQSTQYLTRSDLKAMAIYLKSLIDETPSPTAPEEGRDVKTAAQRADLAAGEALYQDNCAACHRSDGRGYRRTYPPLAGNPALMGDPASLISVILHGSQAPVTQAAPTGMTMPAFGWRLSDSQVAALSTFVRRSWGNQAAAVKAERVAELRQP